MADTPVNVQAVTRFVRDVIGCNCPDSIFQQIQVRRGSGAVKSCPANYELRVGGRLLIVITSALAELAEPSRLENVIAEGRRARDADQFNRFRLVVQTTHPAQYQELLRSFEEIKSRDEKTHLHLVGNDEVPNFFV